MLDWLLIGLGIALAIEGALWSLAPGLMRKAAAAAASASPTALRAAGLLLACGGVALVALAR